MKDPYLQRADEVFAIEMEALEAVRQSLGSSFGQVVASLVGILNQRGKIVVVGVGKSGNIGRKIAATLTSTGSTSVVLDSVDAMHGDLGLVSEGDAVLLLSYSGETSELIDLIPALRRLKAHLIGMCGAVKSTVAKACDHLLQVTIPREACPFNLAPTSSTTAMLVMGDALAMAVLEARGFRKEDFASRHPAGAIGRALLLRVSDVMRSGDRNPKASTDTPIKEALLIMGKAKSGCVSLVDQEGKLEGVFTDGDLRRYLSSEVYDLNAPVGRIMTRNPITVGLDALAVEALNLFDSQPIDDLIVVDEAQRPVGLIDSQDLPKLKWM